MKPNKQGRYFVVGQKGTTASGLSVAGKKKTNQTVGIL